MSGPGGAPTLANRLAVHVLRDLNKNCPKTIHALENWIDQCGFWLAELLPHQVDSAQVAFQIALLDLALKREQADFHMANCIPLLKESMRLHQAANDLQEVL